MNDETREPLNADRTEALTGEPETVVDPVELKSVKDVLIQLTKAAKTFKLYLPNNPIYQKSLKEIYGRFYDHLEEYSELKLRVRQYQLLYNGQTVYENSNPLESLSFKLYVDGVRELSFYDGLELDEITSFLEIIGRKHDPDNPDDDIVTQLWDRGFTHIVYLGADDFIQETVSEPSAPDAITFRDMIQKEATPSKLMAVDTESVLQKSLGIRLGEGGLKTIFDLTAEEVAHIKYEMKREGEKSLPSLLLEILKEILRVEKDDKSFAELVNIVDGLLETFIERGDLLHAIQILELYGELASQSQGLPSSHLEHLNKSFEKISEPHQVKALEKTLNQADHVVTDHFFDFFMLLGKRSVEPLLSLLRGQTQVRIRRALCDVLVGLCKDNKNNMETLLGQLENSEWYVLRNILYILGKIADPASLERLELLVMHEDSRVRKELLSVLDGINENRAKDLLVMCLNDSDALIRLHAARSLAASRYEPALEPVLEIVQGKDFFSKDPSEKKDWFKALGRIGGNGVVPFFQRFLKQGGRAWFQRASKEEMALCAVEGLRRIGTEEAYAVLAEGKRMSRQRIREACEKALDKVMRQANA
jgi:HEAT repeat protein